VPCADRAGRENFEGTKALFRHDTYTNMKAIILTLSLAAATLLTGCNGVAVVESGPRYGYAGTHVYYDDDRPYYYYGGSRYWGYPRGYSGHRHYTHVDVDRDVEINRTRNVYNRNVKKVYVNRDNDRRQDARPTNVKYKQQPVRRVDNRPKNKGDDEKTTNKKGKGQGRA
jgi:hypothetical protein